MLQKYLTIILLFVFLVPLYSQSSEDELLVPTDQYLTDFIKGDTLSDGSRNLNRVYVLQRGATYYLNYSFSNPYPLRFTAEKGSEAKPIITLAQGEDGKFPKFMFFQDEYMSFKNIVIDGIPASDPSWCANSIVFVDEAGYDLEVDSCLFTNVYGQYIRTQSPLRKLKVTNSTFGNSGFVPIGVMGIGKGIDFRGSSCDTAIFRNNTWVNLADRVIRHRGSSASIKYFEFDHNTMVQNMSYSGVFELGQVGEKVVVTNNLLYNVFTYGRDLNDTSRAEEFSGYGTYEVEVNGAPKQVILNAAVFDTTQGAAPNDTTLFIVKNNYLNYSQELTDWWAANGLLEPHFMLDSLKRKLDDPSIAFIKDTQLSVNNIPGVPITLMDRYREDFQRVGITDGTDYDRKSLDYYLSEFDCTYPTTNDAYSGADGGFPVGDLNWFPNKKDEWQDWITDVDQDNTVNTIPTEYSLDQNYPNPFNPSTVINFSIPSAGLTTLKVYNILGQEVATLVNKELTAGAYQFEFNANNLSSGVYFYKLQSKDYSEVRKMMLMK